MKASDTLSSRQLRANKRTYTDHRTHEDQGTRLKWRSKRSALYSGRKRYSPTSNPWRLEVVDETSGQTAHAFTYIPVRCDFDYVNRARTEYARIDSVTLELGCDLRRTPTSSHPTVHPENMREYRRRERRFRNRMSRTHAVGPVALDSHEHRSRLTAALNHSCSPCMHLKKSTL